jgi:hypothetical protein
VSRDLRTEERKPADGLVELTWKSEAGEKRFEQCRALDLSGGGVAVECPEAIPVFSKVIVWAPAFQVAALSEVRHCSWRQSIYVLGLKFVARTATTGDSDPRSLDLYEILRLSPSADAERIEKVYKTLAKRLHPDNQTTGDAEAFLRVADAYRILSDPERRARYDAEREQAKATPRFQLRSREFFAGLRGEQNRRLATLCLLYRKRISDFEFPGLTLLDFEELTGCTREELGFALWYLCEKGLAKTGEGAQYLITAAGVDYAETKLAEGNEDLKLLAAVQTGDAAPSVTTS